MDGICEERKATMSRSRIACLAAAGFAVKKSRAGVTALVMRFDMLEPANRM